MKLKSNKGVPIDMTRYLAQNEGEIAIGNAKMNARGDILGSRGKVVKRREAIAAEYHASNPKAVKKVALRDLASEVIKPTVEQEPTVLPTIEPMPEDQFVDPAKAWSQAAADAKKAARKRRIEDNED